MVVKATKGATDTILYSEHGIKGHRHRYVWPRYSIPLHRTNFLVCYSFSSLDLVVIRSLFTVI